MKAKKTNVRRSVVLSQSLYPALPCSSCAVMAPCSDYKSYAYCSGDLVCVPVELKFLVKYSNVSRMFHSLLSAYKNSLSFSCDFFKSIIVRRFYDMVNYKYVVACYDIKLPDGSFLFSVPEFLLFPNSSSLSAALSGAYVAYCSSYVYLLSPVSLEDSDSSSLFEWSVPPINVALSENFSLSEFLRSDHCLDSELYSALTRSSYDNLVRLVELVLQPARGELGCPIYVSSGYRTPAVNLAVGGSPRSYHLLGRAADVFVPFSCASSNSDLYYLLCDLPHVELKRYGSFIHVAL